MPIHLRRRRLLASVLGGAVAAAEIPPLARAATAAPGTLPLRTVTVGPLEIAYAALGPDDGDPVILLHGWPYDIHSFAAVAPMLASAGCRVLVPYLRGFGATRFRSGTTTRNGQPAAIACDTIAMMDALGIRSALIAGFDWGARSAGIIAALWPERCSGLVAVSGYLIANRSMAQSPLSPAAERAWWYQFYFATERGCQGYAANRQEFNRLIWQLGSPEWHFDAATFDRSAAAFLNPDHVAIVIHNYRWRLGLVDGEPQFDAIEQRLAALPTISVPTVTLEGDANGAPHAKPDTYAARFTGPYRHCTVRGGVGHNLPQEAPEHFARAVLDLRAERFR